MKKLALMFFFSLMFFSCKKDYLIPDREVPDWLKAKISQDEQIIKDSPQLMNSYGAWLRYTWQNVLGLLILYTRMSVTSIFSLLIRPAI